MTCKSNGGVSMSSHVNQPLSYSVYLSALTGVPYDVDSGASVSLPPTLYPQGIFEGHYAPPPAIGEQKLIATTAPKALPYFQETLPATLHPALPKPATYIPKDIVIDSWEDLAVYFHELQNRNVATSNELVTLILDYNLVLAVVYEAYAWASINFSRYTDRKDYEARLDLFDQNILPQMNEAVNALNEKIAKHPLFNTLPDERYAQLKQLMNLDLELFNAKNIPLNAELAELTKKYGQITGAVSVTVRSKTMTVPEARSLLRSDDRNLRFEAWRAVREAYSKIKPELDKIYDDMVRLRHQVALNAGFANFRDYSHKARKRFDYTIDDTHEFRQAIAEHVVPVTKEMYRVHREKLGLAPDDFRPWDAHWRDMSAIPGESPLKPFATTDELIERTLAVQTKLAPELGKNLRDMRDSDLLDLGSRPNKQGGGYNYPLPITGKSFIFMNSVGSHGDMETLQHEVGHGHQAYWTTGEKIMTYQDYPAEIAETASMGMELLSMKYWDEFYKNPEDLKRGKMEQLRKALLFLPWCAVVDEIQQWVYVNPTHTAAERDAKFKELLNKYGLMETNYDGFEDDIMTDFMLQGHLYWAPFYYLEYGISQLGALQLYRNFKNDEPKTLAEYKAGLSLGYAKPLPEVWRAMGIDFDFSPEKIRELMEFVQSELATLE